MNLLKDFLDRYRHLVPEESLDKQTIINFLKEEFGVEIEKKNISFQNGILYLKISPVLRGEILMRKKYFLDEIRERLGRPNYPRDIC